MRGLSRKRPLGGLLIFATAVIIGAALTPEDASAEICMHAQCGWFGCTAGWLQYCHDYGWECFDGSCEMT